MEGGPGMPSTYVHIRIPNDLLAVMDRAATRTSRTRTGIALLAIRNMLSGDEYAEDRGACLGNEGNKDMHEV